MNLINYWYQKYLQEKKENKELLSQLLKLSQELAEYTKENKHAKIDLEKEISDYLTSYHLHVKDGGRVVFDNNDSPNLMCDIRYIAKHFYELGLKAHE
jgi:hypothetical protein